MHSSYIPSFAHLSLAVEIRIDSGSGSSSTGGGGSSTSRGTPSSRLWETLTFLLAEMFTGKLRVFEDNRGSIEIEAFAKNANITNEHSSAAPRCLAAD